MGKRIQNRLDTQAAIFDAAVGLIDQQGYDNTSVEEICDAAGVGRATFFRYFETKAGLLREHNRRLTQDAAARLARLPSTDVGAGAQLRVVADAIHDAWMSAGPGMRGLGSDAAALADPTGARTHPELIQLVLEIVRQGLASGELRTNLSPPLAAYLVVIHLAGAAGWWFEHPDDDLHSLLRDSLDQCLNGIAGSLPTHRRD